MAVGSPRVMRGEGDGARSEVREASAAHGIEVGERALRCGREHPERCRRAEQFSAAQLRVIDSVDHCCRELSSLQTAHAVFGKMSIQ